MKEKTNWKITLFTCCHRTFSYLVPGGYVLWAFLIETLINHKASVWDKVSCSGLFVMAIIGIIAIFFYGRHLKKQKDDITNQCIECTDNEKKKELIAIKKKIEAKQELFRNACFIAPFIIAWFVMALVEKKVVSLRGTLMIVSISMASGLGFNGLSQWLKMREVKNGKN